jgi:hypothetical protein
MLAMTSFSGCERHEISDTITPILIGKGTLHGAGEEGIVRQNIIIRDNESWQNLIGQMNSVSNVSETFTEINVDFSVYMLIAAFDEVKSNGGWTVDITNIDNQTNQIIITVTNLITGNLTCVMSQPYQIVKIPVSNKEIVFETFYKNVGE